jgi:hypothetical protein
MIKKIKLKKETIEKPIEELISEEKIEEKTEEKVEINNKYTRECLCGALVDLSGDSEVFICSCGRKHIR